MTVLVVISFSFLVSSVFRFRFLYLLFQVLVFNKCFIVVVVVVVVVDDIIAVATDLRHPERSVGSLSNYLKFRQSYLLLNDGFGCYVVWL